VTQAWSIARYCHKHRGITSTQLKVSQGIYDKSAVKDHYST